MFKASFHLTNNNTNSIVFFSVEFFKKFGEDVNNYSRITDKMCHKISLQWANSIFIDMCKQKNFVPWFMLWSSTLSFSIALPMNECACNTKQYIACSMLASTNNKVFSVLSRNTVHQFLMKPIKRETHSRIWWHVRGKS